MFLCVVLLGKEKGVKVCQLFPECGNLGLVLPKNLSLWTTEKVRKGLPTWGLPQQPSAAGSNALCMYVRAGFHTEFFCWGSTIDHRPLEGYTAIEIILEIYEGPLRLLLVASGVHCLCNEVPVL